MKSASPVLTGDAFSTGATKEQNCGGQKVPWCKLSLEEPAGKPLPDHQLCTMLNKKNLNILCCPKAQLKIKTVKSRGIRSNPSLSSAATTAYSVRT